MIFIEENKVYQIDCSAALGATDQWHSIKDNISKLLSDVDWIVEVEQAVYLVEYKNANIPGATNPGAFKPLSPGLLDKLTKKYLDTLHYLNAMGIAKPRKYVCILEYPKADSVSQNLVRNAIKGRLNYLQNRLGAHLPLVQDVDVVNIDAWNKHAEYGRFPLSRCISPPSPASPA